MTPVIRATSLNEQTCQASMAYRLNDERLYEHLSTFGV